MVKISFEFALLLWLFGAVDVMSVAAKDGPRSPETILVDGAISPEKIPKHAKYVSLFYGYVSNYRSKLLDRLPAGDDAKMMTAVSSFESWLASENSRNHQRMVELCGKGTYIDPISYIKEREELAAEINRNTTSHIENVIESLSAAGRNVITDFVETDITPMMIGSIENVPLWKTMDRETAQREYELDCYFVANGKYPPELEAEFRQRAAELADQLLGGTEEEQ